LPFDKIVCCFNEFFWLDLFSIFVYQKDGENVVKYEHNYVRNDTGSFSLKYKNFMNIRKLNHNWTQFLDFLNSKKTGTLHYLIKKFTFFINLK